MSPQPVVDVRVSDIRREVLRSMGYILGRPIAETENPSRSTEANWDSLKHVELVFLIEDHFGIRFSEQEIGDLEDAEGIVQVLETKRAS